ITGTSTVSTTGLLLINAGTGLVNIHTAAAQLAITANAAVTLFQSGNIQLNAINDNSGTCSILADSGSTITVSGAATANGGITLSTAGPGTGNISIVSGGSLHSSNNPISLTASDLSFTGSGTLVKAGNGTVS